MDYRVPSALAREISEAALADATADEIMATTFGVPVKRLILVKSTDYQDELEKISYRVRALDPDVILMRSSTSRCASYAPNGTD